MASPALVPNVFVVLDSRFFHAACLIAEPGGCALFVDTTESNHSSRFHHYDEHGGSGIFYGAKQSYDKNEKTFM